jgi:hypothetical protein
VDPQLSAVAIALLFGAAKIGVIGTVGFAIAWIRARARIRALENSVSGQVGAGSADRLDRLEQSMDYIVSQLDRIAEGQDALQRQLPPPRDSEVREGER